MRTVIIQSPAIIVRLPVDKPLRTTNPIVDSDRTVSLNHNAITTMVTFFAYARLRGTTILASSAGNHIVESGEEKGRKETKRYLSLCYAAPQMLV